MTAFVTKVLAVRPLGNNLTAVTLEGTPHTVVANLQPDGTPRWRAGEAVVYVPEGTKVPPAVMQARGYWDHEKGRGLLGGNRHDVVKMRRFGPEEDRVESRGLLLKLVQSAGDEDIHFLEHEGGVYALKPGQQVSGPLGLQHP